jgi:hypothetical protein
MRWSLIAAPVLAGVVLLIFGTAGGISTAFGLTLIGIGATVWMWNWFLRMAFDEEAGKQAAREQAQRDRDQPAQAPERSQPSTLHQHPSSAAPQGHEHQPERTVRRRRRRPQ